MNFTRSMLNQYGVKASDKFVCEWISYDHQSSMVVGLGETMDSAKLDAECSASRGEFVIDGGELVVTEIEDD